MFGLFSKKASTDNTLFFHTDIHCHIVPGIDDGSPSLERSIELVRRMRGWGLTHIIATPHVTEDTFENTAETITPPFNTLRNALVEQSIDCTLEHSAEYRIDDFFIRQVNGQSLMPYPDNYLLVENSFVQEPWNLDQTLFDLKMKGWHPVLAHPERYHYYFEKKERYARIHQSGTLFQINLLSLAGYYGKEEKKTAEWLIENRFVDLIGTDLHRSAHADCIDKYLASKDYARHRKQLEGMVKNDLLFHTR